MSEDADEEVGPVVSGWLLGKQLSEARINAVNHEAKKTVAGVARDLGVHEQTIRRWENAEFVPSRMDLTGLCAYYGIPGQKRKELEQLRAQAATPGWWRGSDAKWPDATIQLLGMEQAAIRIRSWDMTAIPGLLQTPEYARLLIQALEPNIALTQLDADVQLRTDRQAKAFAKPYREAVFVIDDFVFAIMPGSVAVKRAQIAQLLAMQASVTIQVVPFSAGPRRALGSFAIFDFDSDRISNGVYIEGSVTAKGRVQKDVARYEDVWAWLQAQALTPEQTSLHLREILERTVDEQDD